MKIDIALVKTSSGGQTLLIPVNQSEAEELKKIADGEILNCTISEIPSKRQRSYEQLGLYWAGCKYVSENTEDRDWNTPEKVDEQCKIVAKHYEYWLYYENVKTGEKTLNIKTRSIAFANLAHIEACGYFTDAFTILAEKLKMTVDDFVEAVKERMQNNI